jgi:phosphoribosylformimino-5-aminoimidazole carboxamide ribotide isomerase
MIIIPAIDLRGGRVVRLLQGDFSRSQDYGLDPVALATQYQAQGANWLHVVDLDGAKSGSSEQLPIIAAMAATGLSVQAGGGVRSDAHLRALLDAGVARVVVGSLALREPETVAAWIERHGPERIVLALDARADESGEFRIATAGWTQLESVTLTAATNTWRELGAKHFLVTDIDRDGMLAGPNVALYATLSQSFPGAQFIASGGVHALADLAQLRRAKAAAVVIGKALLEGRFSLGDALADAGAVP